MTYGTMTEAELRAELEELRRTVDALQVGAIEAEPGEPHDLEAEVRRLQRLLEGEARVFEQLASGTPLPDVLDSVVTMFESLSEGSRASILVLGDDETIRHKVAPRLPEEYVRAVDGGRVGSGPGACATAGLRGERVIVEDMSTDALCTDCWELANSCGFRSCWSEPIISTGGEVLGTFAIYREEPSRPGRGELELLTTAARLVGIAIEHRQAADALQRANAELVAEVEKHRHTETLLRQREEEMRLAFEHAPLGIAITDSAGRFLGVNNAFTSTLGYSEEELRGMKVPDVTHPDDLEQSLAMLARLTSGALIQQILKKRCISKDGRVIDVEVHAVAVPHGKSKRIIAQLVDNTQQLMAEEEVRQTRERLAHVARISTLGEMATGIAHEVNQPLAAVATYAQACSRMIRARMTDDVELLDTLDRIGQEALRAGAIVNRLKDLVRRRDSARDLCDLNELVRDVADLAGLDARHNDVRLRLELDGTLPEVVVDPVQIQQVVLNLVRNGLEAMEANGNGERAITLRTATASDGEVEVAVVDGGDGVAEDVESELFAPFYTTKESGMGMGLSISRSIVRAHGGRIWFTRNPDRGITFHFTLPAEDRGPDAN